MKLAKDTAHWLCQSKDDKGKLEFMLFGSAIDWDVISIGTPAHFTNYNYNYYNCGIELGFNYQNCKILYTLDSNNSDQIFILQIVKSTHSVKGWA